MIGHLCTEGYQSSFCAGCSLWIFGPDTTFTTNMPSLNIYKERPRNLIERLFHSFKPWRMSDTSHFKSVIIWSLRPSATIQTPLNLISSERGIIRMMSSRLPLKVPLWDMVMMEDSVLVDTGRSKPTEDQRTKMVSSASKSNPTTDASAHFNI